MSIIIRNVAKTYRVGEQPVLALRGVSITVNRGEFVAIMGPSGSGKSTLMNIIGCLDRPTGGEYVLNERRVDHLGPSDLADVRNREIGFVFQSFELLPRATALKNVMLPLMYSSRDGKRPKVRAAEALERVGLKDRMDHRPSQLSGGQKQRVAIARALVNEPSIILADEPTGALDSVTSEEIIGLFEELHRQGQTIIVVTHEEDVASHAQRIVRLRDGRIASDHPTKQDPIHAEYLRTMMKHAMAMGNSDSAQPEDDAAPGDGGAG